MTAARTAAIVTIVAVLIWVFAEGESLRTASGTATIIIETPTGTALRVTDPDGFAGDATLTFRGSNAASDAIMSQLDRPIQLDRAHGLPDSPGAHALELAEVLREAEPFADSGVSLIEVDPEVLRVEIVDLRQVTLPVVAVVEGEYEGVPVVSPESVTIAVPSGLADQLDSAAAVVARVRAERLEAVPLGIAQTITGIRLELPGPLGGNWAVGTPSPEVASVTFTLRDTTRSAVIPQVPVQYVLATTEVGRWNIDIDDPLIENVTISGPSDLVDKVINGGSVRVRALLELSFEELEQAITSKEVEFAVLPAGVGTLQIHADDTSVGITITRRDDGPDDPQAP